MIAPLLKRLTNIPLPPGMTQYVWTTLTPAPHKWYQGRDDRGNMATTCLTLLQRFPNCIVGTTFIIRSEWSSKCESYRWTAKLCVQGRCAQVSHKSCSHFKTIGARQVSCNKFHAEDTNIRSHHKKISHPGNLTPGICETLIWNIQKQSETQVNWLLIQETMNKICSTSVKHFCWPVFCVSMYHIML
jgi:hypothetical protein